MNSPYDDPSNAPLRGMRDNGAASAAELREFLSRMRGKPPQEVLGLIAQSGLARAMLLSTLITLAVLAVTTIIPFALNQMSGGRQEAAVKAAPQKSAPASGEQSGTAKTDVADSTAAPEKTADPKEAALSKLGVGDSKTAGRNVNPLEGRADDILKDFDKK
jgi:hypothetical protein